MDILIMEFEITFIIFSTVFGKKRISLDLGRFQYVIVFVRRICWHFACFQNNHSKWLGQMEIQREPPFAPCKDRVYPILECGMLQIQEPVSRFCCIQTVVFGLFNDLESNENKLQCLLQFISLFALLNMKKCYANKFSS